MPTFTFHRTLADLQTCRTLARAAELEMMARDLECDACGRASGGRHGALGMLAQADALRMQAAELRDSLRTS